MSNYTVIKTRSGLYNYLKRNKELYNLEDQENLLKSKLDFLLDNLSIISEKRYETNILNKYIYYHRLIRKLLKDNLIGTYDLKPCRYKHENHDKITLLLLLSLSKNRFFYILPSEEEIFTEISLEELKSKIHDKHNPLEIYHRPYQKETGPLLHDPDNYICF